MIELRKLLLIFIPRQETAKYKLGQSQESYDKQFLRDWLTANGVAGKDGVAMPEDIAVQTKQKYVEAYENLTGEKWQD